MRTDNAMVARLVGKSKLERIEHDGEIIALVIRKGVHGKGANFFSPENLSFQLGLLFHDKGTAVKPHIHIKKKRIINDTQEVLHIIAGKVEIQLYDENGWKIKKLILSEGDTILIVKGGHGLTVLEKAEILEVKQGPYLGNDKKIIKMDTHM